MHLRNITTFRGEGIYSTIKRDIETKNIDLLYAWDAINRVIKRWLKAMDNKQKR